MFELLATAEAILRIEFNARVTERKKDRLSRHAAATWSSAMKCRDVEHSLDALPTGVLVVRYGTMEIGGLPR